MPFIDEINKAEGLELTDEQKTALSNLGERYAGAQKGEALRRLDADIEALTGVKNEGNKSTHEYMKAAFSQKTSAFKDYDEIKEGFGKAQAELQALKDEKAKGFGKSAEEIAAKDKIIEEMRATNEKQLADFEQRLIKQKQEQEESERNTQIQALRSGFDFNSDLPESVINAVWQTAVSSLTNDNEFRIVNGQLIAVDKNGLAALDKSGQNITAKTLLSDSLADVLVQDGGAGVKGTGTKGTKKVISGRYKTQVEAQTAIREQLAKDGVTVMSSGYTEKLNKAMEDAGAYDLPVK